MFELNEQQKMAVADVIDNVLRQHGVMVELTPEVKIAVIDAAIGEAKKQLFGF